MSRKNDKDNEEYTFDWHAAEADVEALGEDIDMLSRVNERNRDSFLRELDLNPEQYKKKVEKKKDPFEGLPCFLTSACVEMRGLPDDCRELTTLRRFREEYLRKQPGGEKEIEEYYSIAPQVLSKIKMRGESCYKNALEEIYQSLIVPCVTWIEQGENEKAHVLYRETVLKLKAEYCL